MLLGDSPSTFLFGCKCASHRLPCVQEAELPPLPSNARYVRHHNSCDEWGIYAWALHTQNIKTSNYKYFIFLTSSVRGPFLPPYLPVRLQLLLFRSAPQPVPRLC